MIPICIARSREDTFSFHNWKHVGNPGLFRKKPADMQDAPTAVFHRGCCTPNKNNTIKVNMPFTNHLGPETNPDFGRTSPWLNHHLVFINDISPNAVHFFNICLYQATPFLLIVNHPSIHSKKLQLNQLHRREAWAVHHPLKKRQNAHQQLYLKLYHLESGSKRNQQPYNHHSLRL